MGIRSQHQPQRQLDAIALASPCDRAAGHGETPAQQRQADCQGCLRRQVGFGFVWTGPSAARPHDEFGIALSDSLLSPQAGFRHDFEKEIEAYYQFDVSHGWTIQPDLEFWQHPGGGDTPDTWLGLVRAEFTF